jgi:hypothetical protein
VTTLTISVRPGHETDKGGHHDAAMRYIAASVGLLTTLVLIAPLH